ncbi:VCBS repeat-containing protein [Streptomyces sp. NPDC005828]|uniref:C40 family peptidase n=1 Tax=Streptomyces sp. NPDC005828 TaxID=3157071 RepID=UPI0033F37B4F
MNSHRITSRSLALALATLTAAGLSLTVGTAAHAAPHKTTTSTSPGKKAAAPTGKSTTFTPTVANPTTATAEQLAAGAKAAGLPAPKTSPDGATSGSATTFSATASALAADWQPGDPITRDEVLRRAQSWIDQAVPYSQTAYHTDANGTYRQDCSGFISMAWGLASSASNNYGATTWTLPNYADQLAGYEDLKPGDMLDNIDTHVVMFKAWKDAAHTVAIIQEEARPGTTAREDSSYYTTSYLSTNGFKPYRYKNIIDKRANKPSLNGDGNADMAVLSTNGDLAVRNNVNAGGYFDGGTVLSKGWSNFLGGPGQGRLYTADTDNDGLSDLIVHETNGDVSIRHNLGAGKGFDGGTVVSQGWSNYLGGTGKGRLDFADTNGDGAADMIVQSTDGTVSVRVNHNNGAYFDGGTVVSQGWSNYLGNDGQGRLYFTDTNNDGAADMIVHGTDGTVAIRVNHNNGAYFDGGTVVSQGWSNYLGGTGKGRLQFADTNNDGAADMIVQSTDGTVAIRVNHNNGAYFDGGTIVSQGWSNYLGNDGQGRLYFG